ncbi:MAG TPA: NtaA/DmoA family FMN-dependent monooxygenase [Baekduia sp.]|nr:NtaA/DmoA family FMN-dependent monooxygenase [Baekduia sp.]
MTRAQGKASTNGSRPFVLGTLESFTVPAWLAAEDRLHGEDWSSGRYFVEKAKRLEAAKLDFMFFLDTLAVRRRSDGSLAGALTHAATAPQHDPLPLISMLAGTTAHIGLVATASTTFYNPYQLARTFSTIDSLSGGRAGWNIVTSYERGEALNFGVELPDHDERYDRADEFLDLAKQLWAAWDPDAVVADIEAETYIDPDKVRSVDFVGRYYRSAGPLNTIRSPQGMPFLAQAGASPRGRDFAAKHAELTFVLPTDSFDDSKAARDDIRARAQRFGRDPGEISVIYGFNVIFERDGWDQDVPPQVTDAQIGAVLEQMSQGFDIDLSAFPLDQALPTDLPPSGVTSMFERLIEMARRGLTLRESLAAFSKPGDSTSLRGTPEQVAEQMIGFVDEVGGDGIMITNEMATNAAFLDDLTERLVPALREAGAIRHDYLPGATFRESMRSLRGG